MSSRAKSAQRRRAQPKPKRVSTPSSTPAIPPQPIDLTVKRSPPLVQSPHDLRQYRLLTLSNRMQVLLISEDDHETPHTEQAHAHAAAHPVVQHSPLHTTRPLGGEHKQEHGKHKKPSSEHKSTSHAHGHVHGHGPTHGEKAGTTRPAAVALSVRVGHFSDPDAIPGLAHFLEHMLFMGTEKYKDENGWEKFLSEHGGFSNASTDSEYTTYHFEVNPAHLSEALDRFAQFFVAPLFKAGATKREIRAVHSEFRDSYLNDTHRVAELLCHTARPDHPFHKFGWGNLETLEKNVIRRRIELRKQLLAFHRRYYSSHAMKLVIYSRDLDAMEAMVIPRFAAVPNNNMSIPNFISHGSPFDEESLGHYFNIVPVKELLSVALTWPMPPLQEYYLTKPSSYIEHLIGHEGPGSLFSLLRRRGWVTALMAGTSSSGQWQNTAFWLFSATITLTNQGFAHRQEVLSLVFQYLRLLRQSGPLEWVHNELRALSELSFRFQEKTDPVEFVEEMAINMHLYPEQHVLAGNYVYGEYDEKRISETLSHLTASNCRIDVVSQSFKDQATERADWFNTKYYKEPISKELLDEWDNPNGPIDPALRLPAPNTFIPNDFTIRTSEDDIPTSSTSTSTSTSASTSTSTSAFKSTNPAQHLSRVVDDSQPILLDSSMDGELWYKLDRMFRLPRVNAYFLLQSPVSYDSPLHTALTTLLIKLMTDALAEPTYAASLAELTYSLSAMRSGLELKCSGYNQNIHQLLSIIFQFMKQ